MADLFTELIAEPRSLTDELFARPGHLKIFVSSKMAGGVYIVERSGCARVVDGTGIARAWYWERDAKSGPYCSEKVCLGHAATADGLILILRGAWRRSSSSTSARSLTQTRRRSSGPSAVTP